MKFHKILITDRQLKILDYLTERAYDDVVMNFPDEFDYAKTTKSLEQLMHKFEEEIK